MDEMTSHERFRRMFEHREGDRVPIIDSPWAATVERWQREGMPPDASFVDYFGLDHVARIGADINPLVPELVEIGLDGLNPMEVKAGMDPAALKGTYGERLLLHGGINAMLWDDLPAIEAEMRRLLPVMKAGGGYIFSSDHSIPSSVSLEGFRRIVALAKELGAY